MARVVVNYGKTLTELGRYVQRMRHPEPGLKRVGEYVKGLAQQAFKDQSDPTTGRRWAPLRPVTLELRRNKNNTSVKILRDAGHLFKSIHKIITGKTTVAVGSDKVYGSMHQYGGTTSPRSMIPGKRIPARPFLGFDKAGGKEISRIMKDYILKGKK
jgi:phage virion morphogenesis protein